MEKANIIWLSPQELDARRTQAEIERQVRQGTRCSDPKALDNLMDKYLSRLDFTGRSRRGLVRKG